MYICSDGKILDSSLPALLPDNKSYRYGDGLFETIKMVDGRIPLLNYHMDRLFSGMQLLEFSKNVLFTAEKIQSDIIRLCNKNNCSKLARIRLSVSRGEGGIYESDRDKLHYQIECWPGNPASNRLNENGLFIGIYPHATKSMDVFSALKSANYLPYTMAARFSRQQQWNDCLVMNAAGNIADSTIANLFIVKDKAVSTPAEGQGAINGVMKRYLVEKIREAGGSVLETVISTEDVLAADEIFLTNAMNGIRWVGRFEDNILKNTQAGSLHKRFIEPLWA